MSDNPAAVVQVDLEDMVVVLADRQRLPITNMFAPGGGETTDPARAVRVVAGPRAEGGWVVSNVNEGDMFASGLERRR